MSTLTFVRQGSILSGGCGWPYKSFERQDSKNEHFVVVGCVLDCKTGFEAFL